MINNILIGALLVISTIISCSNTSSEFSVDGYVVDGNNHTGISSAEIQMQCNGKGNSASSNQQGFFSIALDIYPDSSSVAIITISKDGYKSYTESIYSISPFEKDTFILERN